MPGPVTLRNRFDQQEAWGHVADDPKTRLRARMFEEMVPDHTKSILDVGCGDGAITNRLAQRWDVPGSGTAPAL